MQGQWLSVFEYANHKGKSISTIRRYIKAGRVKYKEEDGKYYIWTKNFFTNTQIKKEEKEIVKIRFENERLKAQIRELEEKNSELTMLIDVLEAKENQLNKDQLPSLPDLSETHI